LVSPLLFWGAMLLQGLAIAIMLAGCGDGFWLDLASASATRNSDDSLTLQATVSCDPEWEDCTVSQICVNADVFSGVAPAPGIPEAGARVANASACQTNQIRAGQAESFEALTDHAVTAAPAHLVVTMSYMGATNGNPGGAITTSLVIAAPSVEATSLR
jgi:hypothetical protein